VTTLSPTARSTVRRSRERAQTDRSTLYDVLDEALVCHLSVVVDEDPFVVPTGFGYDGDTLYVHGSTGSVSLWSGTGLPVCVAVTVVDGIVYAHSVFHHSMNYRAAVIHGHARALDGDEKLHGLRVITEHLAPGSWDHCRPPSGKELAQTAVLAIDLHESSVKVRSGGPKDEESDLGHPSWAGVLPVVHVFGVPQPCDLLPNGTEIPRHIGGRAGREPPGRATRRDLRRLGVTSC
jgi:nitroimidazol reductase NimA-like FMN-containing flavoprotein (pyridoxamine 5'-phosphate oxidase superfamily)